MTLQEHLKLLGACSEARLWARRKKAKTVWQTCEKPNWLLWWSARTSANNQQGIVLAACDCARTALKFIPQGELRPLQAIKAAERWARDSTPENKKLAHAAYVAAYSAYAASAAAAVTATDVAYAATASAYSAHAAAYSAHAAHSAHAAASAAAAYSAAAAASDAAYAATAAHIRTVVEKQMCDLIRARLVQPWSETDKHNEKGDKEEEKCHQH